MLLRIEVIAEGYTKTLRLTEMYCTADHHVEGFLGAPVGGEEG